MAQRILSNKPPALWRILAAMLYDAFLVLACLIVFGFFALGLDIAFHGAPQSGKIEPIAPTGWPHFLFSATLLLIPLLFFAYFWSQQSQTLGMRAWRLVVVNRAGRSPTFLEAVRRWLCAAFTLLPLGLGLWWRYLDRDRRTLYDRLSGTRLYQLSQNPYPREK